MKFLFFLLFTCTCVFSVEFNIEKFNKNIHEISQQLSEKEQKELSSYAKQITEELTTTHTQQKKQGFVGRLLRNVGLFLGKVHFFTSKHTAYLSGWITGFFEKKFGKNKKDKKIEKLTEVFLEQMREVAIENQDYFILDVVEKISNKQKVSPGEIKKLFELGKQYRYKFYEVVFTQASKYAIPTLLFSVVFKSLKNVPAITLGVFDAAFFIAYLPCLKFPRKKPRHISYCKTQEENYLVSVYYSRIRGYIKGRTKKKKGISESLSSEEHLLY